MATNANFELYHKDFYAWINSQIDLLRQNRVQELDRDLLVEELEDMGKRHQNELVSRLIVLIAYLLKWQYQPEYRSSEWRCSIIEQRMLMDRDMRFSPSLKPFLIEAIRESYPDALHIAYKETGLDKSALPEQCPYQEQELLDEDFWPG